MTMEAAEESHLDVEFDQMLVEMRPHVLRLAHKSERQKCAIWIKKFCEPPAPGVLGRKNRNAYTRLLVHMLKKGVLEGPFTDKPEPGPLPPLPSYMSVYFEDMKAEQAQNRLPDWVAGELGSDVSSIPVVDSIDSPAMRFQAAQQRFTAALEDATDVDITQRKTVYPTELREPSQSPSIFRTRERNRQPSFDKDWPNGTSYSTFLTSGGNSLFKDESTMPSGISREVDMQKKMLEAKFQEDKLRLQQKHDTTVQKILDRKNLELEELKRHYRTKSKEQEELVSKLERKLNHLQKELAATQEARELEISELNKLLEECKMDKQQELDKKISDLQSHYEEEKFNLQKQHTKNIQELLDDTNTRLAKMESEYNQQMETTSAVIRELEARVQQLGSEGENLTKIRNQLEREKIELEGRLDRLQADNMGLQEKCMQLEKELKRQKEDHEIEIRTLRNKYEANLEHMKQDHSLITAKGVGNPVIQLVLRATTDVQVKAQDKIGDLEQQISQLKQALDNSEQQRQAQMRLRNLQQEMDQTENDYQKKLRKLEQIIRDKEDEMRHLLENQKHQSVLSEQTLEEFRAQVERNSSKMYSDMKIQMEKVQQDLHRSKQIREKQAKEAQRQLDELKYQNSKVMAEKQLQYEQEKSALLREFNMEKEVWQSEKEQELESLKETMKAKIFTAEKREHERQEQDATMIAELEHQIQILRDELVQANALRKQQLMELGLLREDEKQKMEREQDMTMSKLRSELEQQRLAAEKRHNVEMEQMIQKTNIHLKEIEKDFAVRADKANETINEQQRTIQELKNMMNRHRDESEHEISMISRRLEEEKHKLKQRHTGTIMALQEEVESQKSRCRQLERQLHLLEQDYEEKSVLGNEVLSCKLLVYTVVKWAERPPTGLRRSER
ncbi:hypothetical protein LSH36_472g02048 [Paralvinella palmiformis]|uniref:DUF4485 domain-containing protein n=1 Tax=Paralvinella palmiformis TaxID=53620 RepID=A0AAD9JAJ4_9ANNE|nr:hypothetical protein LSH36_472g02048 [Paralvinella palmiformis]